jgi:2-amino-4-hydroxy-6-hydroxymethyldihydropteridine diphosphokinase
LGALHEAQEIEITAVSSFYSSAPIGFVDQRDFVNVVARLTTSLDAADLLGFMLSVEDQFGRTRGTVRFGPRTLDLDLLLFGEYRYETEHLQVPHPRMHERRFVLEPLAELEPTLPVPGFGIVSELLGQCKDQIVKRLCAYPGHETNTRKSE